MGPYAIHPTLPSTLSLLFTSSIGRIIQPWGQRYMGCMRTTFYDLHPLRKWTHVTWKRDHCIQEKWSSTHPFSGGSWGSYGFKVRDWLLQISINLNPAEILMTSYPHLSTANRSNKNDIHVPPVLANMQLSISILSWDLLGMIDVEKQKTSNMTSGASGWLNMTYPLKCNMTGWKNGI